MRARYAFVRSGARPAGQNKQLTGAANAASSHPQRGGHACTLPSAAVLPVAYAYDGPSPRGSPGSARHRLCYTLHRRRGALA